MEENMEFENQNAVEEMTSQNDSHNFSANKKEDETSLNAENTDISTENTDNNTFDNVDVNADVFAEKTAEKSIEKANDLDNSLDSSNDLENKDNEENKNNIDNKDNLNSENNLESKETKPVKMIEVSKNDLNKFENSESYRVHLENFEGPLDLLLYLIKDSKVEIQDVKLADITEQYLEYMQELDRLDMEKAAEFIEIAATLLEIKSKSLIPTEREEVQDEEDPEQLLMMRLKEYKLIKEESEKLKQLENVNRLYKAPDESCNDYRIVIKQMKLDNLINAFSKLLARVQTEVINEEERTIERDRWTVEDKIFEVKTMLRDVDELRFTEMIADDYTRGEIITLFSALLELLKRQIIEVDQKERFGEIIITKGESYDG